MHRSRNKLHVAKLAEFIAWAEHLGWQTQEPKSPYEAWRAKRYGDVAIVHRRDKNTNGGDLVHLTTWGASERLRRQWMEEKRNEIK